MFLTWLLLFNCEVLFSLTIILEHSLMIFFFFKGLCELSLNPASMGLWTVYQEPYEIDGIMKFFFTLMLLFSKISTK